MDTGMTVGEMLKMMRDPLGAPFFPPALQALLVATWVLHIFFVTLALGSSLFAVYAFAQQRSAFALQLGRLAARLTPNALGLGIVTGIAPLLFLQTIYDPLWYTANALTGFWSVGFIFVVMGGYSLAYFFYLRGQHDRRLLFVAVASLVLLFFAGWIMHVLHGVSIRPDRWMGWYMPNGVIDTRGITFHAYNVPRLVFMLPLQAGLSLAVVLQFVAWYLRGRSNEPAFLDWVSELGRKLGLSVSPLYAVTGLAWALSEGPEFGATWVAAPLVALGLALMGWFVWLRGHPQRRAWSVLVWLAGLLVVAVVREALRVASLARFGYSIAEYPYQIDWGSIAVFSVTTLVGVAVITYLALVIYQAHATPDGQISLRVERLGKVATGMLGAWFAFFLLVGLYTLLFLR